MIPKPFVDGPEYLAVAATNVYTPPTGQKALIRQIRLMNTAAATRTVSLWLGATGASAGGTELLKDFTLTATGTDGSEKDIFLQDLPVDVGTFLVGLASVASSVTITTIGVLVAA